MSRWLLMSCCVVVLLALAYVEPTRSATAHGLGGACATDLDCQLGLECGYVPEVIEAQCTASCNATPSCQERFGAQSLCLGADLCTRTCHEDSDCPEGALCNAYGWCESP